MKGGENVTELPISDTLKKYYSENGFKFSDFEKACIVYNHQETQTDTAETLKQLARETSDNALKTQINERIEHEMKEKEAFENNADGSCVYKVCEYDDGSGECYFMSFEKALGFGIDRSETERFTIEKFILNSADEPRSGYGRYDRSGKLIYAYDRKAPDEPQDTHGALCRFENMFIAYESPFERGDIVRCDFDDIIGVVADSKADRDDFNRRMKEMGDSSDCIIGVDYITEDGKIAYAESDILTLEKVTEQGDIEKSRWDLLICMQDITRGKSNLNNLRYFIEEYLKSIE